MLDGFFCVEWGGGANRVTTLIKISVVAQIEPLFQMQSNIQLQNFGLKRKSISGEIDGYS